MRFYQQQHPYYCGVDLHARTMHVCIVDADGRTREHVNLPCDPGRFLKLVEPYREQLVVACDASTYDIERECFHHYTGLLVIRPALLTMQYGAEAEVAEVFATMPWM